VQINKSDKGASGAWRRLQFHLRRGHGHLLRYGWNRVRWHVYPRLHLAGRYPDHVDLELSAACNMKCPMCYTITSDFKKQVPHVNMKFELFRRIVDELADNGVYSIRLSWRGEPTLNRHFMDCVRYAKQRGIAEVDSLTNGLLMTPEMFTELVDLRMDWLTISFDGIGEEYEKIRFPAKYDEMIAKIRRFAEIKKERRSVKPVIRIQGVWPAIERSPKEYFEVFEPIADEVSVNSLLDYLHTDQDIEYIPNFVCPVPFQRLVFGSDGRAFMCINDELGREVIGDGNTQTVKDIWNGVPIQRIRQIHLEHRGYKTLEPCKVCYQPRKSRVVAYQAADRVIHLDELVGRPQVVGK
jgi:sulfatase maturation enzyme AslB (radical SAM superfamily)